MTQPPFTIEEYSEIPSEIKDRPWYLHLIRDESGQDLIEYALIAGIIALGAVIAMKSVNTSITAAFTSVATKI